MDTVDHFLAGETIIATAGGDCWETPDMPTNSQVPGRYTFTNKRILFKGNGIIASLRLIFDIPYDEIASIEPYTVVFFPTGIRIWMKDGGRYRLSLRKRKQYMEIINRYLL